MKNTKLMKYFVAALAMVSPMVGLSPSYAADHLEAPSLIGQGDVDLNDLFIFQSPEDSDNAVVILTVNPFAGSLSGTTFNEDASYQFQFDNNGDAVADVIYDTTFLEADSNGIQGYQVTRRDVATNTSTVIATGKTGVQNSTNNGGRVQAGQFDDPFFFDLAGFNNGLNFTGQDAFAGADVSAIVLELPSADFIDGSNNVGVQAVTELNGVRADRVGRPAIATVLIEAGERRDEFNAGDPANDFDEFGDEVNAAIAGLSSQANADALTGVLLPDLLTFDVTDPSGFLNGRRLEDDVIDASLALLSEGAVVSDGVDANDQAFLNVFPFLAPANGVAAVPEPSSAAILMLVMAGGFVRRSRRS